MQILLYAVSLIAFSIFASVNYADLLSQLSILTFGSATLFRVYFGLAAVSLRSVRTLSSTLAIRRVVLLKFGLVILWSTLWSVKMMIVKVFRCDLILRQLSINKITV